LLEVLIALALCGLVMALVGQGLSLIMQAERAQARALDRRDQLDSVERTLRSLIERMDPGGVSGAAPAFTGQPHALAFTTSLPPTAAGQLTRLADVRLSLISHRLTIAWSPHLPNLIDPGANRHESVLLDETQRLDIDYWRPATDAGGTWVPSWTDRDVPRLIRIRIRLGGDADDFPAIVAGPGRDRWRP
jgi:general secretion pathway protein J